MKCKCIQNNILFFIVHSCTVAVIAKYVRKNALRAFLYNLTLCYSEYENITNAITVCE